MNQEIAQATGEREATERSEDRHVRSTEEELAFRRQIEDFYIPQQLVDAIFELGEIPRHSMVTHIGVAFIDIADYTYISKFLSPNENQAVLNGLYTALHWVIRRHGGYLNKIEGDSLMFHFGGLTDPNIRGMTEQESVNYIARELFYTCVEMQRVVALFNQANDKFIYEEADQSTREAIRLAFDIIGTMRNSMELSSAFNALFQIRVRIGANIGEVTLGNFGPDGAKHWDIIGLPVIEAKRMEATAPIGGLRITKHLYDVLEQAGVVDAYFDRFRREAEALFGMFRNITKAELFRSAVVTLTDKRGVQFDTYSVQVSPGLPEAIAEQTRLLLDKGEAGADRIVEFIQYYRGNRFVIQAMESVFDSVGVVIRKDRILQLMFPKKYKAYRARLEADQEKTRRFISEHYSLYEILEKFGGYQDRVNALKINKEPAIEFRDYDHFMDQQSKLLERRFELKKQNTVQRLYFYDVLYPFVFRSIRTSILEFQYRPARRGSNADT